MTITRSLRTLLATPLPAAMALAWATLALAGCGHSMSVTAKGDREIRPKVCTLGESVEVENGDFRIIQKCVSEKNLAVGDGIMETTEWNFPIDRGFAEHVREGCIVLSAYVELDLYPTANTFDESLSVKGKWEFGLEEIRSLDPDGGWQTVTLDMMERPSGPSPYTPQVLRELITQGSWNAIRMEYGWQAKVARAKLDLYCK